MTLGNTVAPHHNPMISIIRNIDGTISIYENIARIIQLVKLATPAISARNGLRKKRSRYPSLNSMVVSIRDKQEALGIQKKSGWKIQHVRGHSG